jgi:5-formyltetrahydrofolate cyclo-ligase
VALYASLADELSTGPFAAKARRAGKALLWPRLAGRGLEFAPARVEDLRPGRYGVPAPPPEIPAVALGPGDLLLVPGVAFDAAGRRLGRGGGHYDRVLAASDGAVPVGVGYAFQLVGEVPVEPHDRPVRAWLCEKGFVWIGEEA